MSVHTTCDKCGGPLESTWCVCDKCKMTESDAEQLHRHQLEEWIEAKSNEDLNAIFALCDKGAREDWWHKKRKHRLKDFWKDGPPFGQVKNELNELEVSGALVPGQYDIDEMADVLIILFDICTRFGWTSKQLAEAMHKKFHKRLEPYNPMVHNEKA